MPTTISKTLFFRNSFTSEYAIDGYEYGFITIDLDGRQKLRLLMELIEATLKSVDSINGLRPNTIACDCGEVFKPFYFDLERISPHIDKELCSKLRALGEDPEGSEHFWMEGIASTENGDDLSDLEGVKQAFCATLSISGNGFEWRSCNAQDRDYIESVWCRLCND
jgi:hypothetical protein